ncbi:long-chain fatty acid--CoA ligase [Niveispirillum fermenti]|uniref:long-chain fatty acid--CoA ligase n=1 Tax=Niveispirillum fermenti TaxID=1233113 RepID=UPI003A8BB770
MFGLMQEWGLTVDRIIDHAARWDGGRPVVSRRVEASADGALARSDYATIRRRARCLSAALRGLGVAPGDRVATLAWNSDRHLESWFAIMGMGAVCHTLNPRLFRDQLRFIINHAGDRVILADPVFADLVADLLPDCPTVSHVVLLCAAGDIDRARLPHAIAYDEWLAATDDDGVPWGRFDERMAAALCYTSGTTGNPKGVLYSHRSTMIHLWMSLQPDVMGLSIADVALPLVPMYHANAWGIPLSAAAVGARLVLPGSRLDPASLLDLIRGEGVTFAAAVPTLWQAMVQHLERHGGDFGPLRRVIIGGAACPESVLRRLQDYGVSARHAWGMTETSPIGTHFKLVPELAGLPFEQQMPYRLRQGRPPLGIDLALRGADGGLMPHDGQQMGRLLVRGPVVASAYLQGDGGQVLDGDGWFDTGDIADIDPHGYMRIADRAKDVIKSGGEWISSLEIENIASSHPKAALCAAIAMPDPKWDERPLLVVQLKPGTQATTAEFLDHFQGRLSKWQIPDDVRFIDAMPLGATGKIDKKALRSLVLPAG